MNEKPSVVWFVGQFRGQYQDGEHTAWDLQGVFASEEEAVAVCAGRPGWFVGPATIGETLPDDRVAWPGLYYPGKRNRSEGEPCQA